MTFNEDPAERARRYISSFDQTLKQITPLKNDTSVKAQDITKVEDAIQRYLKDAKHYLDENKPVTSLASIAYAEGLLDALTFLHLVKDEITG